jgi:hypothetical protein
MVISLTHLNNIKNETGGYSFSMFCDKKAIRVIT